ncbi:hypothetical protein ARALYDRAFT_909535 [Arabidopsis lyrata subsp. lyrata]|uniref:IBB domain-containing protein n=1 Tax=Arabidopsis lyrata subsp. lyrata TaxID=81972 RepID=D7M7E4_ARALL|nr:hypothetical protein ARALYDRAFT_909535 [Arabidopsis lyrata subsp. lyrata]
MAMDMCKSSLFHVFTLSLTSLSNSLINLRKLFSFISSPNLIIKSIFQSLTRRSPNPSSTTAALPPRSSSSSAADASTEVRRNRYKVAVDAEEGRRRREDNMVEKSKREESLLLELGSLPSMVGGVWSDDRSLQLEATTQFRKLLSIECNPPIEEVIQAGVVPRFVEFLTREDYPQLQHYMESFTTYIVNLLKKEKLFAPQGGPIILSQARQMTTYKISASFCFFLECFS